MMTQMVPKAPDNLLATEKDISAGPWKEAWRGFRKNKVALVGTFIVFFLYISSVNRPYLVPQGIDEQSISDKRLLPRRANFGLAQMILVEIFFHESSMGQEFLYG